MKKASHTKPLAASRQRFMPELGLVDLADTTLEEDDRVAPCPACGRARPWRSAKY